VNDATKPLPPFPWPWQGRDNRRLSLLALLYVVALNAWALVAVDFFPIPRHSPWAPEANQRAPLYARYDSGWYDAIVRFGYGPPPEPGKGSVHAFFPLYPELGRFLHLWTGLDSFQSALAVTYAALLFALPLFHEEARRRLGDQRAPRALAFLLLYPAAFFLIAVYTESLYLLLALLAFRAVRGARAGPALLCAFLLGLTRAPAVAVGPALALSWWLAHPEDRRRLRNAGLLLVTPLAGVASWIWGIGLAKGEPGLFFRSMGTWGRQAGAAGGSFFTEPLRLWRDGQFARNPFDLEPYPHFLLFVCVAAWLVWKRRWPDAAWTLGVLALPVLTGSGAAIVDLGAHDFPRYTMTVYPAHFAILEACENRPIARRLLLGVYVALLLLNTAFFTNWHFVT